MMEREQVLSQGGAAARVGVEHGLKEGARRGRERARQLQRSLVSAGRAPRRQTAGQQRVQAHARAVHVRRLRQERRARVLQDLRRRVLHERVRSSGVQRRRRSLRGGREGRENARTCGVPTCGNRGNEFTCCCCDPVRIDMAMSWKGATWARSKSPRAACIRGGEPLYERNIYRLRERAHDEVEEEREIERVRCPA